MTLTFLLPGNAVSGGVRATAQIGRALLQRGHAVRIAYRMPRGVSREKLLSIARAAKFLCSGVRETRWLSRFGGRLERFRRLTDVRFEDNEIVIAVGNSAVEELQTIKRNVIKVRYCHGLVEQGPEELHRAWGGPMPTIAVSPRLIPVLEKYCRGPILGVVPNGISGSEYFVEDRHREGIGMVFHGSPHKGGDVVGPLIAALRRRLPRTPYHVFGSFPRPRVLDRGEYTRYPSVERAREIYNLCKVWLVTSRDEGFCLPILEAMACGCAVVSSRHTNAAELIQDGVNGFIVAYGDIEGYVRITEKLLTNERLRQTVVEEGFKTIGRFTWERAARSLEEVLLKARQNRDSNS